jgi:hypothetical protein
MLLYSELRGMGKSITIGSYSFGEVDKIGQPSTVVYECGDVVVKSVTGVTTADAVYAPEIHLCSYLDETYPGDAPHDIYAYYARDFNVSTLRGFYTWLVREHTIDTILLFDGGTDSLMAGDEAGLGDPIEDIVSVAAVNEVEEVRRKLLFSVGFGVDRFNGVSDASSLRAIAELTRSDGFLGSTSIERNSDAFKFYESAVDHIHQRQRFQSAVAGFIISSVRGHYGGDEIPEALSRKLTDRDQFFVWPLMSMMFAFDVESVAKRSRIVGWLADAKTQIDSYKAISAGRNEISRIRETEFLPHSEDMKGRFLIDFTSLKVVDKGTRNPDEDLEELNGIDD